METKEIKAKIEKKEQQIEKRELLIAKLEGKIKNMEGKIKDWEDEITFSRLKEDLRDSNNKLKTLNGQLDRLQNQLAKSVEKEKILNEVPNELKALEDELTKTWYQWSIEARADFKENLEKIQEARRIESKTSYKGYNEYMTDEIREVLKFYTRSYEYRVCRSNEELFAEAQKDAKRFVIKMYNDIKEITGTVTSWNNVHFNLRELNGVVYGEKGNAKIQTITAGGYNIQRLHLRTLIKKI